MRQENVEFEITEGLLSQEGAEHKVEKEQGVSVHR